MSSCRVAGAGAVETDSAVDGGTWAVALCAEMEAPVDNRQAIGAMIASVGRQYSTVITGIEQWPDERLTIQAVNAKLIEEWKKRETYSRSRQSSEVTRQAEAPRMKSVINTPRVGGSSSKEQPPRQRDMTSGEGHLCHRCGEPGHFRSQCPQGPNDLRSKLNYNRKSENKVVHDDAQCYSITCFNSQTPNYNRNINTWIIDSGASIT